MDHKDVDESRRSYYEALYAAGAPKIEVVRLADGQWSAKVTGGSLPKAAEVALQDFLTRLSELR